MFHTIIQPDTQIISHRKNSQQFKLKYQQNPFNLKVALLCLFTVVFFSILLLLNESSKDITPQNLTQFERRLSQATGNIVQETDFHIQILYVKDQTLKKKALEKQITQKSLSFYQANKDGESSKNWDKNYEAFMIESEKMKKQFSDEKYFQSGELKTKIQFLTKKQNIISSINGFGCSLIYMWSRREFKNQPVSFSKDESDPKCIKESRANPILKSDFPILRMIDKFGNILGEIHGKDKSSSQYEKWIQDMISIKFSQKQLEGKAAKKSTKNAKIKTLVNLFHDYDRKSYYELYENEEERKHFQNQIELSQTGDQSGKAQASRPSYQIQKMKKEHYEALIWRHNLIQVQNQQNRHKNIGSLMKGRESNQEKAELSRIQQKPVQLFFSDEDEDENQDSLQQKPVRVKKTELESIAQPKESPTKIKTNNLQNEKKEKITEGEKLDQNAKQILNDFQQIENSMTESESSDIEQMDEDSKKASDQFQKLKKNLLDGLINAPQNDKKQGKKLQEKHQVTKKHLSFDKEVIQNSESGRQTKQAQVKTTDTAKILLKETPKVQQTENPQESDSSSALVLAACVLGLIFMIAVIQETEIGTTIKQNVLTLLGYSKILNMEVKQEESISLCPLSQGQIQSTLKTYQSPKLLSPELYGLEQNQQTN